MIHYTFQMMFNTIYPNMTSYFYKNTPAMANLGYQLDIHGIGNANWVTFSFGLSCLVICMVFSWCIIEVWGPRTLWVVPSLGRWARTVCKRSWVSQVKETTTVCVSVLVSRFMLKFLPLLHSSMNYEVDTEDIEYTISFPNLLLVMLFNTATESKL